MSKPTALIVAPGRGTYNKPELGYFGKHHADKSALLVGFDAQRQALGQTHISELDQAERFSVSKFTRGDNASGLIYACSIADYQSINLDTFDIAAVTGNSMGWYTTLACAGAVSPQDGFKIVNTMGTLMQESLIGEQLIYPFVDENWNAIPGRLEELLSLTDEIDGLYLSILLGGMVLFGGHNAALKALEARLEPMEKRYPFRLGNHAAFHTPLQKPISDAGKAALSASLFGQPDYPMIDGRGHIWYPGACDLTALWDYTFGHQVYAPYDFTTAITTGIREFAPDVIILLGPGQTLGGALAQALIANDWRGLSSKADFSARQKTNPLILSMGREDQRVMAAKTV